MTPKCRKMAPRWFQEPSWPLLGALGPLLGLLRAILGRREAIWGASEGDLGAIWPVLARTWGLWGRSWSLLGRSWGDLGRPRGGRGRLGFPFGAQIGPKSTKVCSKTRLERLSSSKTSFFTEYTVFQYFWWFFTPKMAPKMP